MREAMSLCDATITFRARMKTELAPLTTVAMRRTPR
jgi:hypothetical protein